MALEVICEVEPVTRPDLGHVRHQVGVLRRVAAGFLIPDNQIARATVSSVAVAHEVVRMGGRAVACLNARDRNLLGFRRDLLTAAAYGVDELLFVYGDRAENGARRPDDLTVRAMIAEARRFPADGATVERPFRIGVTSRLRPLPAWKQEADALFVQIAFSVDALLEWRAGVEFAGPVYAGVLVLGSAGMARRLSATVPQLAVPEPILARLEGDGSAGVDLACEAVQRIRASGAFEGVHLVAVAKYREMAARLEQLL